VATVRNIVKAAFGYSCHIARSSAVIVSHPKVNMYRPGSVTRLTCGQVTLLTVNYFSFCLQPLDSLLRLLQKIQCIGPGGITVVSVDYGMERKIILEQLSIDLVRTKQTFEQIVWSKKVCDRTSEPIEVSFDGGT
jgi:hypothetical protein